MGLEFQKWRASVNVAKGFRQFQKADKAAGDAKPDSAVSHLEKGLQYFATALDHAAKAEDDAFAKAGARVEKANANLQKSLDAYSSGNLDSASSLYSKARLSSRAWGRRPRGLRGGRRRWRPFSSSTTPQWSARIVNSVQSGPA